MFGWLCGDIRRVGWGYVCLLCEVSMSGGYVGMSCRLAMWGWPYPLGQWVSLSFVRPWDHAYLGRCGL